MRNWGRKDLRSKDWAGHGDEGAVDLRFSVGGGDDGAGGEKGDLGAGGDVAVAGGGNELGEGLGESRVSCDFCNSVLWREMILP